MNSSVNNKYSRLFKDTLIFAIGNIGSRLILFILVPLYTNCLTTEEYGIAELLFTLAELLMPFLSLTIHDAVIRYGLDNSVAKDDVIKNALLIWSIGSILSLSIIPIISSFLELSTWNGYIIIYICFRSLNMVEMNFLKAKDMNKIYALDSIIQTCVLAILNIVFLAYLKMGIEGYLVANIIAFTVADIIAFLYSGIWKSIFRGKIRANLLKRMIWFSTPMIFTNISWWVVNSSDKFMVEWILGASSLGMYTVAAKIPSLINVFTNIFSQAWGISAIKEIQGSNENSYYKNVFKKLSTFSFMVCIILVSIIKIFMKYYVGESFYFAWVYVPLLLVSAVFASIVSFFGSLYSATKRTFNSMCTTILGAVINVMFNLWLIKRIGVMGAVIGTVVSYFIVAIIRIIDLERLMRISIDTRNIIVNSALITIHAIMVSFDLYILPISLFTIIFFVTYNYQEIKETIHFFEGVIRKRRKKC